MARLAVEDYFETALTILGHGDLDALTLDALCQHLGVTKGSFYHHFGSRDVFVNQLVDHWKSVHGLDIVRTARAIDEPSERLRSFQGLSMALPHAAERTIRSAGSSDAHFASAVAAVDNERRAVVRETLEQLGADPTTANDLAHLSVAALIGLQSLDEKERSEVMAASLGRLEGLLQAVVLAPSST